MKVVKVKFKDVPSGSSFRQKLSDGKFYTFRKIRVRINTIDPDYEGDETCEAAKADGFIYPVEDNEICLISED